MSQPQSQPTVLLPFHFTLLIHCPNHPRHTFVWCLIVEYTSRGWSRRRLVGLMSCSYLLTWWLVAVVGGRSSVEPRIQYHIACMLWVTPSWYKRCVLLFICPRELTHDAGHQSHYHPTIISCNMPSSSSVSAGSRNCPVSTTFLAWYGFSTFPQATIMHSIIKSLLGCVLAEFGLVVIVDMDGDFLAEAPCWLLWCEQ